MKAILYPAQLQQAVALVEATHNQGTGFLIAPDLLLTASHVVRGGTKVTVTFLRPQGLHRTAATVRPLEPAQLDVALLHLADPPADVEPLPLSSTVPRLRARWATHGFPDLHAEHGRFYEGRTLQRNPLAACPLTLEVDRLTPDYNLQGLSGGPLVVDQQVCGMLRVQQGEDVGAMLVGQFAEALTALGIEVGAGEEEAPLAPAFEMVPNQAVMRELTEALEAGGGGWYALTGSPGSGKSTLVAALGQLPEPTSKQTFELLGYHALSQAGGAVVSSRERILEWLHDNTSKLLVGERAPAAEPHESFDKRREGCHAALAVLGREFERRGQTGVLVLDGLDETLAEALREELLNVLPPAPPAGLAFLLVATSLAALSHHLRGQIEAAKLVQMQHLELAQREHYLRQQLPGLTSNQLRQLAERSEGHPLYLAYLIKQLAASPAPEDTDTWLDTIPHIGGEIRRYYERLWPDLAAHAGRLHLVLTVAATREAVSQQQLYGMLPAAVQIEFATAFPAVTFLFKSSAQLELHHASFRQFLQERAGEQLAQVQHFLGDYLSRPSQVDTPYSVAHRVYHWAASSEPVQAVAACTQAWADEGARQHVAADYVLADIGAAKEIAAAEGQWLEVVRLQLLHQRITYRYDELIGSHASSLATAVLALGQFEAALRYILRGDNLQVDDDEALLFVQQFYARGAVEQARTLRSHLENLGRRLMAEGESVRGFLLRCRSRVLVGYDNPVAASAMTKDSLAQLQERQQRAGDDVAAQEVWEHLQLELTDYYFGFRIWCQNEPMPTIAALEQQYGRDQSLTSVTGFWAALAKSALTMRAVDPSQPAPPAFADLIQKIQELARKYGYLDDHLLLLTGLLLIYGTDSALVAELAAKCAAALPVAELRKGNGVDVNPTYATTALLRSQCQGYGDPSGTAVPSLPSLPAPQAWEGYLASLLTYLGYAFGRLLRLRADGRPEQYLALHSSLRELTIKLRFPLLARGHWPRSYVLPEAVMPLLWEVVASIYRDFFPQEVPAWVSDFERGAVGQLGLYSEGFREVCLRVAGVWRREESLRKASFRVLECLRTHVIAGVQNRWERTEALLRLMAGYAGNRNATPSQDAYREMLATSMGPSWYKEDQFALANTVVRHLPAATAYAAELAAVIDVASAEMTFQRYVRAEKAALVGSLVERRRLDLAIRYYQVETLPSPGQVLANAEALSLDQLRPGDGYLLGAHGLVEPAALLGLLTSPDLDPHLVWVAGLAFSANQDTQRYAYEYGELLGRCANRLTAEQPDKAAPLLANWSADLVAGRFDHEELRDYLPAFGHELTVGTLALVEASLTGHSDLLEMLHWKRPASTDAADASEPAATGFGTDKRTQQVLQEASDEAQMGDAQRAASLLGQHAAELWRQGTYLWLAASYSDELGSLMRDLAAHAENPATLVRLLRQPLASSTGWEAADYLLEAMAPHLADEEQRALAKLVANHFQQLTRPTPAALRPYEFMQAPPATSSADAQLAALLVWHLGHPRAEWRRQAGTALTTLAAHHPTLVVTALLDAALQPTCTGMENEAAAGLLLVVAERQLQAVSEALGCYPELLNRVGAAHHFLIQHYVLTALRAAGTLEGTLHAALWATVPVEASPGSEVALELRPELAAVEVELDTLNYEFCLNGAFCQELDRLIAASAQPLTIADQLRADRYVLRSFEATESYLPPFAARVRYALNQALLNRADQRNWNDIKEIMTSSVKQ